MVKLKWLFHSDNCKIIQPYTLDKTFMQLDVFDPVHPIFFIIFYPFFWCLGLWIFVVGFSCKIKFVIRMVWKITIYYYLPLQSISLALVFCSYHFSLQALYSHGLSYQSYRNRYNIIDHGHEKKNYFIYIFHISVFTEIKEFATIVFWKLVKNFGV